MILLPISNEAEPLMFPTTESASPGLAVPIPTLPVLFMEIPFTFDAIVPLPADNFNVESVFEYPTNPT